ncbi:chaperone modulator CbpM [Caballeronia sp. M23-90]
MTSSTTVFLQGEIVEESVEFTLGELSRASGASAEQLSLWVAEGAFELRGHAAVAWRFTGSALRRAATAQRLTHDFGLNPAGVALALDLLEEIETLRRRPNR